MTPTPRVVLIKACLNGSRSRAEHEAIPVSPEELARAGYDAVAAGAGALHVHPRRADGTETLEAETCGAVIGAIQRACPGVPLGLTTGLWIEREAQHRLAMIEQWRMLPDFVSVNFSEEGTVELCAQLRRRGVGIEAGLATVADAEALVASGLAHDCVRVLIEVEEDRDNAVEIAAAMDEVLHRARIQTPRLYHGFGAATWAVLEAALARGRDIRVGMEDTLTLPDGRRARDNAALVAAAVQMARAHGCVPARPVANGG